MKVSLVTTCRNELESLPQWRKDLEAQTRPPDEIVIVDACSTDGTTQLLEQWAQQDSRVRLIVEAGHVAHGANRAISAAANDIIIMTHMGCRVDLRWAEHMIRPFEADSTVMVVAGNYELDRDSCTATPAARAASQIFGNSFKLRLGEGFLPCSRSIGFHKSVWQRLGGYPEDLTFAGEDTAFAIQIQKAAFKTAYAQEAMVWWGRHATLEGYVKESFRYSQGNGELGIFKPRYINLDSPRYPWLLANLEGLVAATGYSWRAVLALVWRGDFAAAVLYPLLRYRLRTNMYKGYALGAEHGMRKCLDSRKRVAGFTRKTFTG